jgi:hypothetical protein
VQEGRKLGLFATGELCHAIFTHLPSTTLHSFVMFLLFILDSYASYADDYQPSISDFFHLICIYVICATIADFASFRFQLIPFSLPISVCIIGSHNIEYHIYYLNQHMKRFLTTWSLNAQRIPVSLGRRCGSSLRSDFKRAQSR